MFMESEGKRMREEGRERGCLLGEKNSYTGLDLGLLNKKI